MCDSEMTLLIVSVLGMGVILFGVLSQRQTAARQKELIAVAKENNDLLKEALKTLKK